MSETVGPDDAPDRRPGADGYLSYFCPLCGTSPCLQAKTEWVLGQMVADHEQDAHGLRMVGGGV